MSPEKDTSSAAKRTRKTRFHRITRIALGFRQQGWGLKSTGRVDLSAQPLQRRSLTRRGSRHKYTRPYVLVRPTTKPTVVAKKYVFLICWAFERRLLSEPDGPPPLPCLIWHVSSSRKWGAQGGRLCGIKHVERMNWSQNKQRRRRRLRWNSVFPHVWSVARILFPGGSARITNRRAARRRPLHIWNQLTVFVSASAAAPHSSERP